MIADRKLKIEIADSFGVLPHEKLMIANAIEAYKAKEQRTNDERLIKWIIRVREVYFSYGRTIPLQKNPTAPSAMEMRALAQDEYDYLLRLKSAVEDTTELEVEL